MKKSVFLSFILLVLSSTSWAHNREVTGVSCANPWNGEEGPNYASAMNNTDEQANKKCYPFQAHRISEYELKNDNSICSAHRFGATATAYYKCA